MVTTYTCYLEIVNGGNMKDELYTWQKEAIDAWKENDNKGKELNNSVNPDLMKG